MATHGRVRGISRFLAIALLLPAVFTNVTFDPFAPSASAAACSAGVVTPLHGPKAYYDIKFSPRAEGMYLGYKVAPTSNVANLNVQAPLLATAERSASTPRNQILKITVP